MKRLLVILFSFVAFFAHASHERAGEITYQWISGYKYKIIVTTYTKSSSCQADRCSLQINFGDGTGIHDLFRTNGVNCSLTPVSCNSGSQPPCNHCGQVIGLPADEMKKNIYDTVWTYPGPNSYTITVTDPNRNSDIVNVPNQSAFSIFSILTIPNTAGFPNHNNSVILANPPIDKACSGRLFIHNAGASDPDGDSLSYKLGMCLQGPDTVVVGYFIPPNVSIDPITGDFTWNTPPPVIGSPGNPNCDEYNFAFDIQEWKINSYNHKRYLMGVVRRDMQVKVCDCQNDPPVVSNVNDTCIEANTALTLTVTATDLSNDWIVTFDASGGPFSTVPPATFISDAPQTPTSTGVFSWTPSCNEVRLQPYLVTFRAEDDGSPDSPPIPLTDYETFFIRVIAPPVENLTGSPECTTMKLSWDAELCNPTLNPLLGYRIYRKTGCDTLKPGFCQTGMPASWGYTLVGTVANTSTTFTDNSGLVHGLVYAYRVVARYLDGSESYVSDPLCATLVRDVPILTNVDVTSTGSNGSIDVKWIMPLPGPGNYDTTLSNNTGPYKLDLMRGAGFTTPVPPPVATFSSPYFATLNTTSYPDAPLNTQANAYTYRLDFYDVENVACPTQKASSVFLSCTPNDNEIKLTWQANVPWTNYQYDIYKFNGTSWDSIGTTASTSFTDTGLVNGVQYCYKVKSIGAYPDPTLPAPLINWSQELCCSPVDQTPPCPLTLAVDSSCVLIQNVLTWNNPNNSCCDDAIYYIIYYMPVEGGDFSVLDTVGNINITTYTHDSILSIAGCYVVTAVDSFGNEGAFSNMICVDNCPYYELPNVFTPNGDGTNDFFTPLHPYKFVKDIDIKIYNRWGYEVFRTTDPEIMWNGKSAQTDSMCSDGVYYYVCIVNDIRLVGIVPRVLTGNVHLLSK